MLLLFAFSITPRVYLHDLFANHEDLATYSAPDGEDELSVSGFQCNTQNQVAESPFTGHSLQVAIASPVLYPTATTQHLITNVRLQVPLVASLRGPPAIA
jgi:hypothetical protein